MDRVNIFSGGAFRVTLYATSILVFVTVAMAAVGYRSIQAELYQQIREQIGAIVTALQTIQQTKGDAALLEEARIAATGLDRIGRSLDLFDAEGQKVVGTLLVVPDFDGWTTRDLQMDASPAATQDLYLVSARLGVHTLVVGAPLGELHRIEVAFIRILFAITAFLSILFIGLGYATSRLAQRKLDQMSDTLERVSDGQTDARLIVSSANDQIDRVSRKMNNHLDTLSALITATRFNSAAIAHDLNRPLAHALLGVDRALELVEAGADPQVALEDTRHELANLNGIFDTILRIARIDTGHAEGFSTNVDLVDLTRDLGETFQVVAEESGQFLTICVPDGSFKVRGDSGMLTQMLVNLLQNAITHGSDGNHITLSLKNDDGNVRLIVADTGPGIPEADRDRVLTAFVRLDAARTAKGNGLGLALVKSIVVRHGASLALSDNDPGLRVTVTFPHPEPRFPT